MVDITDIKNVKLSALQSRKFKGSYMCYADSNNEPLYIQLQECVI